MMMVKKFSFLSRTEKSPAPFRDENFDGCAAYVGLHSLAN